MWLEKILLSSQLKTAYFSFMEYLDLQRVEDVYFHHG